MSRITCKNCGEKNERKFDKCWNCEWPLDGGERQRATRQDVRLEGNSLMGVMPLRQATSHHGNDGDLAVTPIATDEARRSRSLQLMLEQKEITMKFKKKPVVIEAVKFTGENGDEIAAFMSCQYPFIENGGLMIGTLEGSMRADPGDWIIKGVKGEFYPIKDDIFRETYEPA